MAVSTTAEAVRVRDLGGLTAEDIAAATGATPEPVPAGPAGTGEPAGAPAARLSELAPQVERLASQIKRDAIAPWMRRSVPMLGGERPLDVFAAGGWLRIAELVSGLESPGAI